MVINMFYCFLIKKRNLIISFSLIIALFTSLVAFATKSTQKEVEGITVPIIPGIKPIINLNQLTILPKVFKVDLPTELATELIKCKDDVSAKNIGVEWCITQVKDLIAHGVPSIHFYSHNATQSVKNVVSQIF